MAAQGSLDSYHLWGKMHILSCLLVVLLVFQIVPGRRQVQAGQATRHGEAPGSAPPSQEAGLFSRPRRYCQDGPSSFQSCPQDL